MGASLSSRLRDRPVFFEVVPPHRRASARAVSNAVQEVEAAVSRIDGLDAINLPEVLDENHRGEPYYRNMDPREFARIVRDRVDVEIVTNKVVVHLPSLAGFREWLHESETTFGLRDFVLVGGTSSRHRYPGPSVVQALTEVPRSRSESLCGVIAIPEREREAERLFRKTLGGCHFATTQVQFASERLIDVLRRYHAKCTEGNVRPVPVLLSSAPVADYHDVEFLRWLGGEIPVPFEEALLKDGGRGSIEIAAKVWTEVRTALTREGIDVPLGLNVEQIARRNHEAAITLATEIVRISGP